MNFESGAFQSVQKLFQLQDERVHTYRLFEEAYKIYMATAPNYNFTKFRQIAHGVTKDFKRISNGIIAVEKQLRFKGYNNIANLIVLLQQEEELRLRFCVELQIAKQEATDNPDIVEKWNSVASIKEMYNKSIQKVDQRLEDLRYETEDIVC